MMDGQVQPFEPYGGTHPEINPAVWCESGVWNEATIPPRPWIAPGYMLRKAVTLLLGPGGVSKSSLVIAYAVSLALGQPFNGMKPRGQFRAALFNTEDDNDEQKRRLSATLTSVGKTPSDIEGRIMRVGPTRTGLLFDRDPQLGIVTPTPAMEQMERDLIAFGADVLFVDPLAELHGEEENDNTGMRAIIAEFRGLAVRCNLALVIVHHTRKGAVNPGDADAGRGASSVIGAARVALTVTAMLPEQAKAFGMPEEAAKGFFRVDGGKSNYATLTECEWFERVGYSLANGDQVAAVVAWEPPKDALTIDVMAKVEAAIKLGTADGPYSPQISDATRSIKAAMVTAGIGTRAGQIALLAALERNGFQRLKFMGRQRKLVSGLRSPDGFPDAEWEDDDKTEAGSDLDD